MATATLARTFSKLSVAQVAQQKAAFSGNVQSFGFLPSAGRSRKLAVKASKITVAAKCEVEAKSVSGSREVEAAKAMAGALFMLMANANSAMAAQEIAQLAEGDNRPFLLLLILGPAVGWVLFNILQPALNQFNKMKGIKSVVGALGLGAAGSMLMADNADAAQEIAQLAEGDNRPFLLLLILGPAIGWVLFNILKPALNQFNKMKGVKSVVGAVGLGAAGSMLMADNADAAQEIAQLADGDSRPFLLLFILLPALGWVLFNILQPALRQIDTQIKKNSKK